MSPPNQMVNLDEFFRLILTNWTKFIDPQKLIAFILKEVRDKELPIIKGDLLNKKSIKITISHLQVDKNKNFILWIEFVIPKKEGVAVGTCEVILDPLKKHLEIIQTLGNIIT